MKKLFLVCEGLHNRAGIERMTVDLANLLCSDYEVTIVVIDPFTRQESPFAIDPKVNVISLDSSFATSPLNFNIGIIRRLRHVFKQERPVAVITVATPLVRLTAPACAGLGIRNIGWEHFNIFAGSKMGVFFKMLASWMADATVVLTEADARDYRKLRSPEVLNIPNFTNIGVNDPSHCDSQRLVAVGRHAAQKGFDMLIKAWAKTDAPGWTLRIVGSGADKEQNEALARELITDPDRIEFVDAHPEIAGEFQEASCFVLSSRFEGLVLVLIEAKMMGLPCISFDCPNSPREVIRDGVDGWLVENGDPDALAEALTLHLADRESLRKAGAEARIDAQKRYSPEAVKECWIKLIENR